MNRIKEHYILAAAIAATFAALVVSATDIPRHALYLMEMTPDKFVHPQPDPEGQWVLYDSVQPAIDAAVAEAVANCASGATTDWFTTPLVPEQNEPTLLCEIKPGIYALRNYTNGQWRNGTSVTPAPLAWARINARIAE